MIKIELLPDRTKVGCLTLFSDNGNPICGPFPALGLADDAVALSHHNPNRDSLLPYGDTPLGTYNFSLVKSLTPRHAYGPHGAIAIKPLGGPALIAQRNFRSGLLIHSGDAGPRYTLRPTHGAIRLFDADMELLMHHLASYQGEMECVISSAPIGSTSVDLLDGFKFFADLSGVTDAEYPQSELTFRVQSDYAKEYAR